MLSRTPLIVIDPGHGGSNAGAPSVDSAIREKHVTLTLARALGAALERDGYRVLLTRERDEYLTLRERATLANRAGADLFISLHTNATEAHAQRGYETFILSPRALEVDSRALRGDEGEVRTEFGADDADVAALLADVERGLAQEPAAELARRIQDELRAVRGAETDRGVKQESMHVLLGATMPAVLVEVGFVDHAIEGRELLRSDTQAAIVDALCNAIAASVPTAAP